MSMNVILPERVAKLGQMGEVVSVKEGYARNYLLPQKKALWASKSNVEAFEQQKSELQSRNEETKAEAQGLADRLEGQQFTVIRAASDGGALYGSVSTRDVAEAAAEAGFEVDRRRIALAAPIKDLGIHEATVTLHPEVEVGIELNVARSVEEAELQKQGKSIQELAAEEEAAAEFEIQELFDDIGAAQLDELESEDEQRTGQPAVQEKSTLAEKLGDDD